MIEIKNVTKYDANAHTFLLKDVSFKVRNRKICGLLAPKGGGKSTLLNIIAGAQTATDGTVLINGYDIAKKNKDSASNVFLFADKIPYSTPRFVFEK